MAGGILVVGLMALGVAAGFVVIRSVTRRLFGNRRRLEEALGLEALEARRRQGTISPDEFEQAKRALGPR